LSNQNPYQGDLQVGDVLKISGYPLTLTKVENHGGGVISGEGWVPVRWIFNTRFGVEFQNIPVNTDKIVIGGEVTLRYRKDWKNVANLDKPKPPETVNGIKIDVTVDFVIPPNPEFEYNETTGALIIYDLSGNPHNVELPKNAEGKVVFPVTIKDKDGNVYEVTEEFYTDENGYAQKRIAVEKVDSDEITQTGYIDSIILSKYFLINNDYINAKTTPNKDVYICQNTQKINISFFKQDSTTIVKQTAKWNYSNNNITDSVISIDISRIGVVSIIANIDSVNYSLKLNVYKAPNVDFNVIDVMGNFGFDKYTRQYAPHRNDFRKEDHQILLNDSDTIYVPNISFLPNQHNVRTIMTFKNYTDMLNDSLLQNIKMYSANQMVKINNKDTLIITKNQINTPININITTNNAGIKYDSVLIKTSYNKLIGKLNIFSQPTEIRKLLLVHIQTDSMAPPANFSAHIDNIKKKLNDSSYNQAFFKWDISTTNITYDDIRNDSLLNIYNDTLNNQINNLIDVLRFSQNLIRMIRRARLASLNNIDKVCIIFNGQIQTQTHVFAGLAFGIGGWGFALSNNSYDAKAISHELGHCLKLHHPFGKLTDIPPDNKSTHEGIQRESVNENDTENIMDYDKTRMHTFWLWQWIIINDKIKYYTE
jgi:hypothetical protein